MKRNKLTDGEKAVMINGLKSFGIDLNHSFIDELNGDLTKDVFICVLDIVKFLMLGEQFRLRFTGEGSTYIFLALSVLHQKITHEIEPVEKETNND